MSPRLSRRDFLKSASLASATLAWPLIKASAALLTEVAEGEDPGPSQPAPMTSQTVSG